MHYVITQYPGDSYAMFHKDAFKGNIGKEILVNSGDTEPTTAKVLDVWVSDDGMQAEILLEIPDDTPMANKIKGGMLYGFTADQGPFYREERKPGV